MSENQTDSDSNGRAIANATGAVKGVRTASETVDGQLVAIDDRAGEQVAELDRVATEVSDLSATIEEVAASSEQVAERSEAAAARSERGRAAAVEAKEVIETVRERSERLATEMSRLDDRIDTIETALAGIDDIARQTNLLALNASIEAARADDDGETEGFGVVADEIKTLAAESQEQADTIESALEQVQAAADETVAQLEKTTEQIEAGADNVANAMDEFEAVAETVEETANDVKQVSTATDDLAESSETIAARSEHVSDRAAEIEDSIVEIRDARGEQTAMLREVEDALSSVSTTRSDAPRLPTGLEGVDDPCDGLIEGGQSVLHADSVDINDAVAQIVVAALTAGHGVSLTPPPGLTRGTLEAAFDGSDDSLNAALREDRLFVLDAFDAWAPNSNVFDLTERSLGEVNAETARRRDDPLLIVGNIAAEIEVLGEEQARAARYENDESVFEATDTVLNVVDGETVDDAFAAFYAGAADQVFRAESAQGTRQLTVAKSPDVTGTPSAPLERTTHNGMIANDR